MSVRDDFAFCPGCGRLNLRAKIVNGRCPKCPREDETMNHTASDCPAVDGISCGVFHRCDDCAGMPDDFECLTCDRPLPEVRHRDDYSRRYLVIATRLGAVTPI